MSDADKKSLIPDMEEADPNGGRFLCIDEVAENQLLIDCYFDERHQDPRDFAKIIASGLRYVANTYAIATNTPADELIEHMMTALVDEIINPSDSIQPVRLM